MCHRQRTLIKTPVRPISARRAPVILAWAGGLLAANGSFGQCVDAPVLCTEPAAGDQFGFSTAMSGDLCVVGARLDDGPASNCGAAYVFRFDPVAAQWIQEARLAAADAAANDEFGHSVACFSQGGVEWVVVGARHDDDTGTDSGSAYVFQKFGAAWAQVAKLRASDAAAGDRFGFSVAMHGDCIVVGSREDDTPLSNAGSAYVYRHSGSVWAQQAKLRAADAQSSDHFGHAVAVSPSADGSSLVALITAWQDDDLGANAGAAYLFRFDTIGETWIQEAKLLAPDGAEGDLFGYSAALAPAAAGEIALLGARWDDDGGDNAGSAYLFRRSEAGWGFEHKLNAANALSDDEFGAAVALTADGRTAVVGAMRHDLAAADAGAVFVFRLTAGAPTWQQAAGLVSGNPVAGGGFGASLAVSGDRVLVGASLGDFAGVDSGAAEMFKGMLGDDSDNDGVTDGCDATTSVEGDANGDGLVDHLDVIAVLKSWGMCPPAPTSCPADLSGDGMVSVPDLLIVLQHWEPKPCKPRGRGGECQTHRPRPEPPKSKHCPQPEPPKKKRR